MIYFQRAARTDKGVSALKQILSCNLPVNFIQNIPKVNQLLPEQIRIIAAKRATKHFDAKNYCDARTYAYLMPSYTLTRPDERTSEEFRVTDLHIKEFNSILQRFKGTHNFHNFTSQKLPTDVSATRYIINMECGLPFIKENLEFVIVRVKGQSFMLHQIRKMLGLAIGIMRGFAHIDVIEKSFLLDRIDIPKAPGLGLMLEEVHYDKYNYRYGGNGIHERLTWEEYQDVLDKFRHAYVYPNIIQTEAKEYSMLKWLQLLPIHSFDVRQSGPPKVDDSKETNIKNMDKEAILNKINNQKLPYFYVCINAGVIQTKDNQMVGLHLFTLDVTLIFFSFFMLQVPGDQPCYTSLSTSQKAEEKRKANNSNLCD